LSQKVSSREGGAGMEPALKEVGAIICVRMNREELDKLEELRKYYEFILGEEVTRTRIIRMAVDMLYADVTSSNLYGVFKRSRG